MDSPRNFLLNFCINTYGVLAICCAALFLVNLFMPLCLLNWHYDSDIASGIIIAGGVLYVLRADSVSQEIFYESTLSHHLTDPHAYYFDRGINFFYDLHWFSFPDGPFFRL